MSIWQVLVHDILISEFDADFRDCGPRLEQMLQRCRQAIQKLNKEKCLLSEHTYCFGEVISRCRVSPDPAKVKALLDMLQHKTKTELRSLLSIVNYLGKCKGMAKQWEVVGTCIFMINNKDLLCIVDDYSRFPIVKKAGQHVR